MFARRQGIKSWINQRQWVNPYWPKLSEHPGRIFLEQDLSSNLEDFKTQLTRFDSVICEFGSGSGEHLLYLAKLNPSSAVIGFELRFKRVVKTIEKAKKANLENVFVICGYAQNVSEMLIANSVSEIYLNFPDPWEKKVKNRLLNKDFLLTLSSILVQHGSFNFKTDHRDYFISACQLLEQFENFKVIFVSEDLHADLPKEQIILTEFERLFLSQNLKINALKAEKIGS